MNRNDIQRLILFWIQTKKAVENLSVLTEETAFTSGWYEEGIAETEEKTDEVSMAQVNLRVEDAYAVGRALLRNTRMHLEYILCNDAKRVWPMLFGGYHMAVDPESVKMILTFIEDQFSHICIN